LRNIERDIHLMGLWQAYICGRLQVGALGDVS